MHTGDPIRDYVRRDIDEYEWEKSRPVCDYCYEHIQDEYCYDFNGTIYCPSCIEKFKKYID